MSTEHAVDERYLWPFEGRLRHAMRYSDVTIGEISDELEVHRNTVGAWLNGRNRPRRRDLKVIALRTGFSLEWLETGKAPAPGGGEGRESRLGESNPRPIHYKFGIWGRAA